MHKSDRRTLAISRPGHGHFNVVLKSLLFHVDVLDRLEYPDYHRAMQAATSLTAALKVPCELTYSGLFMTRHPRW